MRVVLLVCIAISWAAAEPPVGRQYLPPGRSRPSMPTSFGRSNGFGSVSAQYGTPSGSFGRPSSNYGAPPQGSYSRGDSFGRAGGNGRPSSQYGAPFNTFGNNGGYNTPSTGYGAPTGFGRQQLSSQYGTPSAFDRNGGNGYSGGYPGRRYNEQEDPLAEPANYEFQYEVNDVASGSEFGHEESRQDENAIGSYNVLLPDGRRQIVEYQADEEGFQPNIRYEETGRVFGSSGYNYNAPGQGGRSNSVYSYEPAGRNGGRY